MSDSITPPPAVSVPGSTDDRTVAILSYITLLGFIVAIILHSNKKTALGSFHLRQCLGLIITGIALSIGGIVLAMIPIIGWLVMLVLWVTFLIFIIMGLVAAIGGRQTPLPVVGEHYQKWFANAFV